MSDINISEFAREYRQAEARSLGNADFVLQNADSLDRLQPLFQQEQAQSPDLFRLNVRQFDAVAEELVKTNHPGGAEPIAEIQYIPGSKDVSCVVFHRGDGKGPSITDCPDFPFVQYSKEARESGFFGNK
jgi:hypothetical protein